jgi:hypothetical protein
MKEKESIKAKLISFMKGVASISGASGPKNPYEGLSPEDADAKALKSDWETVGDDIRIAIGQFQKSTTPSVPKNRL